MHKLMPWWLLHFIDRHSDYCWTHLAMWKLGYSWEWKNMKDCEIDERGCCFCGKVWPEGAAHARRPPAERCVNGTF